MSNVHPNEGRLRVRVCGSVIRLKIGTESELDVSTEDAPELIRQLMARGRRYSAKAVYEAWWVALASEHGFDNYELGGAQ